MFKTAMAGMIIFLTNPIIPMRQRLIEKAKLLPEPESYFRGREIGGGFRLPSSLLLYWHDYPHERTIISTRHMLILPAVPMEYLVSGNRIALEPGRALLVKPYLRRSVPEGRERHDRLIVSFEAEEGQPYLPAEPLMEANDAAFAAAERLVDAYLDGDTLRSMFELVLLLRELSAGQLPRRDAPLSPPVKAVLNRINQELTAMHREVLDNLNSIHGALLRMNRSIQAEGTFGVMKYDRRYRRIVRIQILPPAVRICFPLRSFDSRNGRPFHWDSA